VSSAIIVSSRFNGPLDSGNGGYSAGLFAARLGPGPVTDTLRSPIPLDPEIGVEPDGDGARFLAGETLIAEAAPAPGFAPDVPEPPAPAVARKAAAGYPAPADGLFAKCFVCGRAREDSFRVFAGPAGDRLVASPWTPPEWTAGEDAKVRPEFSWAVLDCPTYFAAFAGGELPVAFMAQVTAEVLEAANPGEEHVVAAWPIASEGRKHRAGSGVFTADGRLLAVSEALMIEPRPSGSFG
jgi:hypothetical protein